MKARTSLGGKFNLNDYVVYIGFAVIFVFFSITLFNRGFFTGGNLMNITQQTTMISVMAIGMTFTLSAGKSTSQSDP